MDKELFAISWVLGILFVLCGLFYYFATLPVYRVFPVIPTFEPNVYHPYRHFALPHFVVGISILIIGSIASVRMKEIEFWNKLNELDKKKTFTVSLILGFVFILLSVFLYQRTEWKLNYYHHYRMHAILSFFSWNLHTHCWLSDFTS